MQKFSLIKVLHGAELVFLSLSVFFPEIYMICFLGSLVLLSNLSVDNLLFANVSVTLITDLAVFFFSFFLVLLSFPLLHTSIFTNTTQSETSKSHKMSSVTPVYMVQIILKLKKIKMNICLSKKERDIKTSPFRNYSF